MLALNFLLTLSSLRLCANSLTMALAFGRTDSSEYGATIKFLLKALLQLEACSMRDLGKLSRRLILIFISVECFSF